MDNLTPFVKWAGGKRQLIERIKMHLPKTFNRYIEPFVGGGAVAFELNKENSLINDINPYLINTYKQIRDDLNTVISYLDEFDDKISKIGKTYYYAKREHYNEKIQANIYDAEQAALFIFLNKHCFNGLYRVNSKGLFNVPYNNSKRASYNLDNLEAVEKFLRMTEITCGDFENAAQKAQARDFVFFDSPYAPLNPTSFEAYTKEGFTKENHIRLAKVFQALTERGCYCMLTNHNTPFIMELYKDFKDYIDIVSVRRAINSNASKRIGEEVIIRNYQVEA